MRPLRSLLLYFAFVFIGGALLAPWLYLYAQVVAVQWPALDGLASNPFYRFVLRAILALAILGLWPLLASCRMRDVRSLGLACADRPARNFAFGLVLGFASLALVALLAILCGARDIANSHTGPEWFHYLRDTIAATILVPIIEELIFRGALFGILRKSCHIPCAMIISSAVYAAVHFLQKAPPPAHIDWLSGLKTLPQMLHSSADGLPFVPAFFTLFLAGVILALAYQRSGSLYISIGLHAGWIFWIKSFHFLTVEKPGAARAFWGSDKLIDGWLPFCILAALLFLMQRSFPLSADPNPRDE